MQSSKTNVKHMAAWSKNPLLKRLCFLFMATCFIRYLSLLNVWWIPFQVSWGKLAIVSTDKALITKGGRKHKNMHRDTEYLNSRCRERVETIRQDQTAIHSGKLPGCAKRRKVSFKQKIHNNISSSNETWQKGHSENLERWKKWKELYSYTSVCALTSASSSQRLLAIC